MTGSTHTIFTIADLRGQLSRAYAYLEARRDETNTRKVKQLAEKLVKQEFALAFCGHFSAGKSRMINCLIGENLLPSSPIPTSANLVKVRKGEEYAKVFFKKGKPRLYQAPYDYELVKKYCKDGDQIDAVELSHCQSQLPADVVVLDTPGIDSADDAHRIATESAIHLADLIFYVMDYNHVQSELNFMFTRELREAGKEVYLVINQIDKHNEEELAFSEYKDSVLQSFASWGVVPADIFYTSLKEEDHSQNEFVRLQAFLQERLEQKNALLLQSIQYSLRKILQDHLAQADEKDKAALAPAQNILQELSAGEQEKIQALYLQLQTEREALATQEQDADLWLRTGVDKILDNAYLMPFETRAKAQAYLESCQDTFKVGLFFTRKKTEEEKLRRLDHLYQEVAEKAKSQVEWHVRNFLNEFLKTCQLDQQALTELVKQYKIEFTPELLTRFVKEGARLSQDGGYVQNFTDNVANEIKNVARRSIQEFKDLAILLLQQEVAARRERMNKKMQGLERFITALDALQKQQAEKIQKEQEVAALFAAAKDEAEWPGLFSVEEPVFEIIEGLEKSQEDEVEAAIPKETILPAETVNSSKTEPVQPLQSADEMKRAAKNLQAIARMIQPVPGFQKTAEEFLEKAARLENKGFTVALFGAFSAGKSSFANALLGDAVLPVSPNPMTAAINKIKPVDAIHPHGKVLVQLKSAQVMLEDINAALQLFSLQAESLAEAARLVPGLAEHAGEVYGNEKTSYTFLQAFARGYEAFADSMGEIIETTAEFFADYAAKEEKSCFVSWIDFYYDCPLTRKGITLVDTPGADSINARHTGVAFEFIKNSDAILFVTYYNHAFSKADREFLIQLGRVKDAFELDKMFFLINAIDLADSEEEKNDVQEYVKSQLIQYGVRNPHLYPISSLQALQEKRGQIQGQQASGLPVFEEEFYHFIEHGLAHMAASAAEKEWQRVLRRIEKLLKNVNADAAVKKARRLQLETEKHEVGKILSVIDQDTLQQRFSQETQELLYYIKQRVFLRFNEFFKESFNPAVLRDDGRDLKKMLRQALQELLFQMGFDFAQELRAATLRLDRFMEKILQDLQENFSRKAEEKNEDLSFSRYEILESAQMDFSPAFEKLEPQQPIFQKSLSFFKNPKSFFEKNESQYMNEALYEILSAEADLYLKEAEQTILAFYENILEKNKMSLQEQMQQQTEEFYFSMFTALDGGVSAGEIESLLMRIKKCIGMDQMA